MAEETAPTGDFRKLWAALSISLTGSEITTLALPLIAALTLRATPFQMGLLAGAGMLPYLVCSLPVGILADRMRRRPLLILSDVGSAFLLLTVPLAIPFGGPYYVQLCVVAFGVGTFYVITQVSHYSYVPTLVGRGQLTRCNSRLQISHSASEAAGPGLAGLIIQALSAPLAVVADALSFLASAELLQWIRQPEERPSDAGTRLDVRESILDGLRVLFGDRMLRAIALTGPIWVFFDAAATAIYLLYATRQLGLNPATIGMIAAAGGVGAIPGAILASWAGRRFGVGPAIIGGWFLSGLLGLMVPIASGPLLVVIAILAVSRALKGLIFTVANVHQWSLRQALTPDRVAGRVTAAARFVIYGAGAVGSLAGGVLGGTIGLRATLFVCAFGCLLSPLCELLSPMRRQREQPVDVDAAQPVSS